MTYRPYPNADRARAQIARHDDEYCPLAPPQPRALPELIRYFQSDEHRENMRRLTRSFDAIMRQRT